MARIERLEKGDGKDKEFSREPQPHGKTAAWNACAIVIGTWPFGTPPEERRQQVTPILASLTGMDLFVIVPNKSSIVKVEFDGPHAAGQGGQSQEVARGESRHQPLGRS